MENTQYGKLSRYHYGVTFIKHKGATVSTSVGTEMDDIIEDMPITYKFKLGRVPLMFENRPDNISDTFYESPRNWWLLMQYNGYNDPFEFFNAGEEIKIPEL
jgi:hypothetical protein